MLSIWKFSFSIFFFFISCGVVNGQIAIDSIKYLVYENYSIFINEQNQGLEIGLDKIERRNLPKEMVDGYLKDKKIIPLDSISTDKNAFSKIKGSSIFFTEYDRPLALSFVNNTICLISDITKNNCETNWKFYQPLLVKSVVINQKLTVFLLMDAYLEEEYLLVPMKNGQYSVNNFIGNKVDSISSATLERGLMDIKRGFKISESVNMKKGVSYFINRDKHRSKSIVIPEMYDSLSINVNFVFAYLGDNVSVFNLYGRQLNDRNIRSASIYNGFYPYVQCIDDYSCFWMDYKGNVFRSKPEHNYGFCGTVPYTLERIKLTDKYLEYYKEVSESGLGVRAELTKSNKIKKPKDVEQIYFLNGKTELSYTSNDDIFSKSYSKRLANHYIIKSKEKFGICMIDWEKGEIEILIPPTLDYIENGHFPQSLLFRENGLYGYYPQMTDGKYLYATKFDQSYGFFEKENGKSGWIDLWGNEFERRD